MTESFPIARLALAQLEYQPSVTLGFPYIEEPVLLGEGEAGVTSLELTIPEAREQVRQLRTATAVDQEAFISDRVKLICSEMDKRGVDVLVFPEYAIPAAALAAIDTAAGSCIVVAASHTVTPASAALCRDLGLSVEADDTGRAICPVRLGPRNWIRIDKLTKSRWESSLKLGSRWAPIEARTRHGDGISFLVLLCVDFVNELDANFQKHVDRDVWNKVDFVVVPSYSPTTRDFDQRARSLAERAGRPVAYTNVASVGGTRLYCNFPSSGPFFEQSGTKPLGQGDEAVVLADVHLGQYAQFNHRPTPLPSPTTSELIGVLPVLVGDTVRDYVSVANATRQASSDEQKRQCIQSGRDQLMAVSARPDTTPVLRSKIFALLGSMDWRDGAWIDSCLDAILIGGDAVTIDELRFSLLHRAQTLLARLVTDSRMRGAELDAVVNTLDVYRRAIDRIRPRVRSTVTRKFDPTTLAIHTMPADSASPGFTSLFLMKLRSARLHREALGKQIRLISTLAYQANRNLALNLRYVSLPNPGGNLKNLEVQIIGAAQADDRADSRKRADDFRRDLANLMQVTLRGAYLFDLVERDAVDMARWAEPFPFKYSAELYRRVEWGTQPYVDVASAPRVHHLAASSTMARILDSLQRSPFACMLSVHLQPTRLTEPEQSFFKAYRRTSDLAPQQREGAMFFLGTERHPALHLEHAVTYQRMLGDTEGLTPSLIARMLVASDEPLSSLLLNTIGYDLWGNDSYQIVSTDAGQSPDIASWIRQGWVPSSSTSVQAPSGLERVPFLFDPYEASRLFRLPLEGYSGAVGTLFAVIPAPAAALPDDGIEVGLGFHSGAQKQIVVRLADAERSKHTYVVGKTGTGKSTLLARMIEQDIQLGSGVCVIDPHGDLVDTIAARIPADRIDDVVLIDPANTDYPFGLNLLEYNPAVPHQKEFVVQDTIAIMRKLFYFEHSGPVFEHNLRHLVLTMLDESMAGEGTLIEVPRPLFDRDFRRAIVPKLKDEFARDYWTQYEQMTSSSLSDHLWWIVSKFDTFVVDRIMRNIVGQAKSTVNIADIVQERRILLVKLPSALIGEINAALLGMIILSKIRWAGMARAALPPSARAPYYVYVDEFQNFAASGFETILAEARKYGISLVLAHQHLGQLSAFNVSTGEIEDRASQAIFGNTGTMIIFRVGVRDAKLLAAEAGSPVDPEDLENLKNYHAIVRTLINDEAYPAFTIRTVRSTFGDDPVVAAAIRQKALEVYGRRRQDVEAEIRARLDRMKKTTAAEETSK